MQIEGVKWLWAAVIDRRRAAAATEPQLSTPAAMPQSRPMPAPMASSFPHGRGAILADAMGLGKTCTALTLALAALRHGVAARVLIVAPASLLVTWQEEVPVP